MPKLGLPNVETILSINNDLFSLLVDYSHMFSDQNVSLLCAQNIHCKKYMAFSKGISCQQSIKHQK